jgi:O-glycosyl hydrolase
MVFAMKIKIISLALAFAMLLLCGCKDAKNTSASATETKGESSMESANLPEIKIDAQKTYQAMESFGGSGAWWAQDVGLWTKPGDKSGLPARERIAKLLYDKEEGIGLTNYRYNIGAGSKDSRNGKIDDPWRRAASFETAPGQYDWTKDEGAVWFLKKAVELGANEVVLFCNSPLERLTVNNKAHSEAKNTVNLLPENYGAFADYVLDVAEHFVSEGVPVKFISPINEPQWDWLGGQEGCHYSPEEVKNIYKVFLDELEKRSALSGVELSGPEGGEWKNDTLKYVISILRDERLSLHFSAIDNHSYWSNAEDKKTFKQWMDINFPNVKLRMSEWCEMVNGKDLTMDSALNLANEVIDDLTILDVVSWQCWILVSNYSYRDGLIYVDTSAKTVIPTKRLWSFGNFSKFIRPGYTRVEATLPARMENLKCCAFTGENDSKFVVVLSNAGEAREISLNLPDWTQNAKMSVYTTDAQRNLEQTYSGESDSTLDIPEQSVTTVVFSKD